MLDLYDPHALEDDTKSSTSDSELTTGFPFMKLLPEIRRHIFSLILPAHEILSEPSSWVRMEEDDWIVNPFMNLLISNKQVSNEACEVLYGLNCFTVIISDYSTTFMGFHSHHDRFETFPSLSSTKYIKNWQLDLHVGRTRYDSRIRESLLGISEELSKIDSLQTLKVKFPCLCDVTGDSPENQSSDRASQTIKFILQSLKRLYFENKVTFIAARPFKKDEYSCWRHGRGESCTHATQCDRPDCLGFLASFDDFKHFLQSPSLPRVGLSDHQRKWLNVKQRATICPWDSFMHSQLMRYLEKLWVSIVMAEEEFSQPADQADIDKDIARFQKDYRRVIDCLVQVEEREKMQQDYFDELMADGLSTWDGKPRETTESWQQSCCTDITRTQRRILGICSCKR
ncbi:MAG: hypothetical protein Q9209_006071 [Squamulea sp. 1 TL-2023]